MVNSVLIIGGLVGLLVLSGLIGFVVMVYNSLVRLNKNIDKSWSNIDVLLKQRNDEIPKLIDSAEEYMDYEEEVLKEITEARNEAQKASSPGAKADADQKIKNALGNFFAVAEDYPDLKSTEQFQKLQERISDIEDKIADRREFYNQSVNTYNIRINQIPYNIIANMMGYQDKELFQVSEEGREDFDISEQFN